MRNRDSFDLVLRNRLYSRVCYSNSVRKRISEKISLRFCISNQTTAFNIKVLSGFHKQIFCDRMLKGIVITFMSTSASFQFEYQSSDVVFYENLLLQVQIQEKNGRVPASRVSPSFSRTKISSRKRLNGRTCKNPSIGRLMYS